MNPDVSYRRGLERNYIIIKSEQFGDFQTQMLLHNDIPGLLNLQVKNSNNEYEFCYEISSLQPISRIYEHKEISYQNLATILRGISEAVKSARNYMLDNNGLMISPTYIYADVESLSLKLIHYPMYDNDVKESYRCLSEFILDRIDHQDNKAVMLAYDLFKIIKSDSFVISEIDRLIELVENMPVKAEKAVDNSSNNQLGHLYDMEPSIIEKNEVKSDNVYTTIKKEKKSFFGLLRSDKNKKTNNRVDINKEEHSLYNDISEVSIDRKSEVATSSGLDFKEENEVYGKTVLLSASDSSNINNRPRLVSKDGKKEYSLEKLPITIGKSKDIVDIVLKDSSVSRMHASIFLDDNGKICIKDLSSSNGTYINGVSVDDIPMQLELEDEVMFGRVKFDFYY